MRSSTLRIHWLERCSHGSYRHSSSGYQSHTRLPRLCTASRCKWEKHAQLTTNTSYYPVISHEQPVFRTMSSSSQLPASSMHFKLILDVALTEYQKKTKKNLLDYWLATELKSCESTDAVLGILRDQAEAIERTNAGDQRLMKRIGSSVNVLSSISDTLGEGISLVSIRNLIFDTILTLLCRHFHLRKRYLPGSVSSFLSVYFRLLFRVGFYPEF